jgi:dTDP-4-dehydrorhamnose reductase
MAKTLQEPSHPGPSLLIVDVESQIGSALFGKFSPKSNRSIFRTRRRKESNQRSDRNIHLDLSNPDPFITKGFRFDHVVVCAGVTSIDNCELDLTLCRRINLDGTLKLIQHFSDYGCHVAFLSSNIVFDGSKPFSRVGDNTYPNNNYRKLKKEVENRFRNNTHVAIQHLIKVITPSTSFVKK